VVADGGVELGDLLAGVGDDKVAGGGSDLGERGGEFDVGGVDDDLARRWRGVEDLAVVAGGVGAGAGAHGEGEVGLGGIGDPVHGVQVEHGGGVGPGVCVVEDSAAADGGELVPVPDQGDPGTGLVGDGQESAGGVLVEHPGLVDQEQVPGPQQPRGRLVVRFDRGPAGAPDP